MPQELVATGTPPAPTSSSSAADSGLRVLQYSRSIGEPIKVLIQPHIFVKWHLQQQQLQPLEAGAILFEASAAMEDGAATVTGGGGSGAITDPLRRSLACSHCDLRVVVRKDLGVVSVTNLYSGELCAKGCAEG